MTDVRIRGVPTRLPTTDSGPVYSGSGTSAREEPPAGRRHGRRSGRSWRHDLARGVLLRSGVQRRELPEVRALRAAAPRVRILVSAAARAAALNAGPQRKRSSISREIRWPRVVTRLWRHCAIVMLTGIVDSTGTKPWLLTW